MNGDVIVHEFDSSHYAMHVDEPMNGWPEGWWKWPAQAKGWTQRSRIPEPSTAALLAWHELPPKNAALALKLSGVEG